MKSKKALMGLAALFILIFHFYIPFSKSGIELSIQKVCYIGVDLFFLLSAHSLGKKDKIAYWPFIWNRIKAIYIPFAIFSGIAAIYKSWGIIKFLKVISFVDLFQKGGGAFLWFAPGIMLLYFLVPGFVFLKKKLGFKALGILLIFWAVLAFVMQYLVGYTNLFILINRLPIFFIGMFFDRLVEIKAKKIVISIMVVCLVGGAFLLYKYGVPIKNTKPVSEFYYITAIPLIVALAYLINEVYLKCSKAFLPLDFIGKFTFELYCLQMIFGYDIETFAMKQIGRNSWPFFIAAAVLIVMAFVASLIRQGINKLIVLMKKKLLKKN